MEVPCTDAANSTVVTCLTFSDLSGTNPTYQHFTPEVIQFQQTDPTFARYVQLVRDCTNLTNQINSRPPDAPVGQTMVDDQQIQICNTMINQAIDQFCSFTAMNIAKCNASKEVINLYQIMSGVALG